MTKVYIEQQNAPTELPMSLVFWPNFRFDISPKRLFLREIMAQYPLPFLEIATRPEEADFFAIPFEYFFVKRYRPEYLARVYRAAKETGKKVLLFDYTDYVDRTPELPPHAILFRASAYRHHLGPHEVVMPYFVEDFGKTILPHAAKLAKAVIGFCGLSRYGSGKQALKAWLKWRGFKSLLSLRGDSLPPVHAPGISWRRRALSALRSSNAIDVKVIERASYSLHQGSVSGDPARLRAEYQENMAASTLALCVRGDANASQRFYEALSAGRVPLLLDTDSVLPLEGVAPYEKCLIRVPHNEVALLPGRAAAWHAAQTAASFLEVGKEAKNLFQNYLRLDRYFEIVFDRGRSPYKKILYEN